MPGEWNFFLTLLCIVRRTRRCSGNGANSFTMKIRSLTKNICNKCRSGECCFNWHTSENSSVLINFIGKKSIYRNKAMTNDKMRNGNYNNNFVWETITPLLLYSLVLGLRACNNNVFSSLPRIAVTMYSIFRAPFEGAIRFRANSNRSGARSRDAPFVQRTPTSA